MSESRWSRKVLLLTALIGTTLLAAYPVPAQDPAASKPDSQGVRERALFRLTEIADFDRDGFPDKWVVASLRDPADELLGATLQPVTDALRAQLEIPAGQGLLVASVRADGPSAQAGLKQNDILLTLADKPLASADDLTRHLKAAGESAVPLKFLRAGKQVTIQVRPSYRVTLGPVAEPKTEYYIGVSLDPADDALRAQLGLPTGQGVLITDVVAGSPAEKAGVKKHDIVLELGGRPVASPEELARQVQAVRDTQTTVKLLRAGKPMTLQVTGAVRKVEASPPREETLRFWATDVQPMFLANSTFTQMPRDVPVKVWAAPADGTDELRQRLDHLEKELKALREALDKLNETLKGTKKE
jgi:C-terminal processing protease CtpA/Prc